MKCNLAVALRLGAVLLLASALVFAHHGISTSYDSSRTFTTPATVVEFCYANPHPQLYFDEKDEQGNVLHWRAEIGPNPPSGSSAEGVKQPLSKANDSRLLFYHGIDDASVKAGDVCCYTRVASQRLRAE